MKKFVNLILALSLALSSVGFASSCKKEDVLYLNVYNAEEYISEYDEEWETVDIIEEFEKWATEKYGKKVVVKYSTFGTLENMYNELQLTKRKSGDGYVYNYDLVCPSDYMIQRMINENMLEKFDYNVETGEYASLDNYNDYASGFITDLFSSSKETNHVTGETGVWSEYAVCYMWGTMGFVYNPDIIDEEDAKHWDLPWNLYYKNLGTIKDSLRDTYSLSVGYVYRNELLTLRGYWENGDLSHDEYKAVLVKVFNNVNTRLSEEFAALDVFKDGANAAGLKKVSDLFDGKQNSLGKTTVDAASEELKTLKNNVYGFEVDSCKKDMAAGKIAINFAWSGDAAYTLDLADEDGTELYYSVPEEGSNIWFDAWVMPKGANKELAQDFVNFLSSPEMAISNMDYIGYVSPIAGNAIFEHMTETYELSDTEDEDHPVRIDYSYYFDNLEDGVSPIVYSSEDNIGRQLTTQYPLKETVDRCALMTALPKDQLKAINAMWSDVKVGDVPTAILIGVPVIVLLVVIILSALAIAKKKGFRFERKKKYYGKLVSSERIR